MRIGAVALAVVGTCCATVILAPFGDADPTAGHGTIVSTQTPPLLCQIGSDDADAGVGPSVVCQTGGFPQAPTDPLPYPGWTGDPAVLHQDQAVVTAAGQFSYRDANIGVGYPHIPFDTLVPGQTYHIQGWTIVATGDGITFTNDASGHGMVIVSDKNVKPF